MRARLTITEQLELFTGRRCTVLICENCGEHFLNSHTRSKNCSWGCKKAAQRRREAARAAPTGDADVPQAAQ